MKKGIIVIIAAAAFSLYAMPAGAESCFNGASKWIASWDKPCAAECKGAKKSEASSAKAATAAKTNFVPANKAAAK